MKKSWFLILVCFVLMLSGCKTEKLQDDEAASVITDEQPPAEDEKQNDVEQPPAEELNEDNADVDTVTDEENSESMTMQYCLKRNARRLLTWGTDLLFYLIIGLTRNF